MTGHRAVGSAMSALVVAISVSGCSSSPKPQSHTPSPSATATETPANSPAPTETPSATVTPPPTPVTAVVPAGFSPMSVTFVSTSTGFVLGTHPCAGAQNGCLALARTDDGGHTWHAVNAPPAAAGAIGGAEEQGVNRVRFADARNGWVFGAELWSTHDGGAHWTKQSFTVVESLETAAGVVHAIVGKPDNSGYAIVSAPVGSDSWTTSTTTLMQGAGPVPMGQIVLQGTVGWAIEQDRTVLGGARLSGGRWASWSAVCSNAGGSAALAAGTTTRLAAVCNEGQWFGTPGVHVYVSSNGGAGFTRFSTSLAPMNLASAIAENAAGTLVVGGETQLQGELLASFDGGSSWTTVFSNAQISVVDDELGFTTTSQGVAVVSHTSGGSSLLMTYDGGHHWSAVSFG